MPLVADNPLTPAGLLAPTYRTRIWLVAGVTDMRKSFNGLGEQVQHVLNDNPFSGHLFIFRGRRGDTVKILWADADG
ncbi:IS66 family insertion sequence element accessory protein TnpB, partial [Escherichia coli]|uniref:IS66 family insertion sequence element accessory protein TnpB n=1 Tax=Escherichia coli TaxID=562 RepID=UPI001BED076A